MAGRRTFLGLVAGTLLMAGAGAPAHAADYEMDFVMPTAASPYLLPFFIAQDLGWYEEAGLTVNEAVVTGDTNCIRAVITGEADTTFIGPNTIMQAFVSGAPIKIIGSWQPVVDYQIVAKPGYGDSLADLADKRWAISSVGGMVQSLPQMAMKKHGIDPDSAQFMSVGGYAARYQALAAGTVDATLLDTRFMMTGLAEGRLESVSAIVDDFPKMGFVYLPVMERELADPDKRAALEIFLREALRGVRLIMDEPEEAAKVMAARLKIDDVEGTAKVLEEMTKLGVWGANGGLDRDVFEFSEDVYREHGDVTKDVPYEALVDTSIADAAVAALGAR
ncbi:ABC transporter substrate-binding protein [Acuticoccus kandeliae]|uniref:ABC transporter substrate-binding protein n=1 Tax=Acuticoccus kandeliae TaxID=2073160 RepID=UPI00196B47B7|nr:ABC transporter substrate-binding protein [Acuticoccus kandeliae]